MYVSVYPCCDLMLQLTKLVSFHSNEKFKREPNAPVALKLNWSKEKGNNNNTNFDPRFVISQISRSLAGLDNLICWTQWLPWIHLAFFYKRLSMTDVETSLHVWVNTKYTLKPNWLEMRNNSDVNAHFVFYRHGKCLLHSHLCIK